MVFIKQGDVTKPRIIIPHHKKRKLQGSQLIRCHEHGEMPQAVAAAGCGFRLGEQPALPGMLPAVAWSLVGGYLTPFCILQAGGDRNM